MMTTPGLLGEYLTEFDDRISSELNLDPLGLQVIWSAYGQAIFRNRISSISNDVRNYTLNLFNHRLAKSLVDDDSLTLGRGLQNRRSYAGQKDSQEFKQACLIHMENLFTFAMVEAEMKGRTDVATTGVLGILKARRQWEEQDRDPTLVFSHRKVAYVLARQSSLGVSGRYKTPLVQMKFFDSAYDYALPDSRSLWRQADEQLFARSKPLAKLQAMALAYMKELLSGAEREPLLRFSAIPTQLKRAFVAAFKTPPAVGAYPSQKVGLGISFEARTTELQEVLDAEWDPSTVAYFDQAPAITLRYVGQNGRRRAYLQRPDFVRVYDKRIVLRECKTEAELLTRSKEEPNLFSRDAQGTWHCPPAECAALELGLVYEIVTASGLNPTRSRNLDLLIEYLSAGSNFLNTDADDFIVQTLKEQKRLTLSELLDQVKSHATVDDIYRSLALSHVLADLDGDWLGDHDRCYVYTDVSTRDAYSASSMAIAKAESWLRASIGELRPGQKLEWDCREWTVGNIGVSEAVLR